MQRCMGCMAEIAGHEAQCPHCGYVQGTAPREAYHLNPESILAARYIVGRVLGYGGFGVTYIGYDAQLERKVAIKEFLPSTFATRMPGYTEVTVYAGEATEQFEAGLDRFVEEAQRLARFNGVPGIVDIYDTFVENNTAYIVMEYLKGQDVKELLSAGGPLPYERAREIILSICDTLEPVHAEGIIHRDISPDNIFITDDGKIKLLDFGASRYATSINSKSLSVILKSGYAPEEQYRSRGDQGPWSDVYALAATFYKMLTGITPEDSMERAIKDELQEPGKLVSGLPKSAENAILNAMNIRKEERTQSAKAFKEALLADGVERVKPKPVRTDVGKMGRTTKLALFGTLAVVVVFGALTLTGIIDFGQGNLLRDTFGSSVPEGYMNAPGVLNKLEDEARQTLDDAGLTYLIVGKDYSDKIEKGKILSQEPLPGRLIEQGGEINVRMSGGSYEEALAGGEDVPIDVTLMTIQEASLSREWEIVYVYSDTVAEGLVVSYGSEDLYVSAGRKEELLNDGYGEVRAPYIRHNGGKPNVEFAVVGYRSTDDAFLHRLSYSTDGGSTWREAPSQYSAYEGSNWSPSQYDGWSEGDGPGGIHMSTNIHMLGTDFGGADIMFRVERYHEVNREMQWIDATVVPGTIRLSAPEPAVQVDTVQMLTWDEAVPWFVEYQVNITAAQHFGEYVMNHQEDFTPFLLTGDFAANAMYTSEGDGYRQCLAEGELLTWFQAGRVENGMVRDVIYPQTTRVARDEDGVLVFPAASGTPLSPLVEPLAVKEDLVRIPGIDVPLEGSQEPMSDTPTGLAWEDLEMKFNVAVTAGAISPQDIKEMYVKVQEGGDEDYANDYRTEVTHIIMEVLACNEEQAAYLFGIIISSDEW